jgi:hypothetical protein
MSESSAENPGLGVVLGSAGSPAEIHHAGRVWKLGHPDQRAKERLEKLVAKVALDDVRRLKDVLDPDAYAEAFGQVTGNLRAYKTWREGWQKIIGDPGNGHLFLWALLLEHQPGATESDVLDVARGSPGEVAAALSQVLPPFLRMLAAEVLEAAPAEARPALQASLDAAISGLLAGLLSQLTPSPANTSTP